MKAPPAVVWLIAVVSFGALAVSVAGMLSSGGVGRDLLIFTPALAVFVVVGGIVLLRRPSNAVGGLLLAFGASGSVMYPFVALGSAAAGTPGAAVAGVVVQALDPITYLLVSALLLVFPDGALPSPRWRPILALAPVGFLLSVAGNLLTAGPLMVFPQHDNPFGVAGPIVMLLGAIGYSTSAIVMVAAALSLVVRWRRSGERKRAQLKWIALTGALLAATTALYVVSFSAWGVALIPLIATSVAFALFPASVGIAVLRYRLYEIDRIISRTIGWAAVTGVVGVLYLVAVLVLQGVLGGITQGDTLAVAGSTLLAAAAFQPLRRRIQRVVDRRFHRSRYDSERTAAQFAEALRDEVDAGRLGAELRTAATSSLGPAAVSVWLRGTR
jgi:hypothetical protein